MQYPPFGTKCFEMTSLLFWRHHFRLDFTIHYVAKDQFFHEKTYIKISIIEIFLVKCGPYLQKLDIFVLW